jgi:hypothetical protein
VCKACVIKASTCRGGGGGQRVFIFIPRGPLHHRMAATAASGLFESDAYMSVAGVASVVTAVAMGLGISLRAFFPFLSVIECVAAAAPLGLTLSAWVVSARGHQQGSWAREPGRLRYRVCAWARR